MNNVVLHGVGVGFRSCHYPYIIENQPDIPWFEILSDNYLENSGPSLFQLEKIRESYPITLHGVGMSLGSTDPLDYSYLKSLKQLIARVTPALVSDHLCWTSFAGQHFHELLPLPFTEEAVNHVASRIIEVQDYLGHRLMIENVSSYLQFNHSTLTEWEFLHAVANKADCFILLDINNIYVSATNHQFNPGDYLNYFCSKRVAQFHLAGFEDCQTHLMDTHGSSIHPPVWELFNYALQKLGAIPTIIEWDNHLPEFTELMTEAKKAHTLMEQYEHAALSA